MPKSLPVRPSLEQLRNQARDLHKSLQSGNAEAIARWRAHHSRDDSQASFTLAEAQLVIAREYGFASWPKLKEHVQSILLESADPLELCKQAFHENDAVMLRRLLGRFPQIKARINEPIGPFDSPAITAVRTREMLDVLLEAGADINAKSRWWAGGFGLLHSAEPELAAYAIERGAQVDVHAAARLGFRERLAELISSDPNLVHARGGDGQTPLHFASTIEIARFLLERGADIDARDVDHESTPAQHMLRDRTGVARYLVEQGCQTDLLMAAALGDAALVRKHLEADPSCIYLRISHEFFPMRNPRAGGTIYQWTLGWHVSAHQVAREFGHENLLPLLLEFSPDDVKLIDACWSGDRETMRQLVRSDATLIGRLREGERRQLAHAARNNNPGAVRLMLEAGLPVTARGQHGGTALHWAAFHGNTEMTREILQYAPPLELPDADFRATPLGWAMHGSENGWFRATGDYAGVAELLLAVGAKIPDRSDGSAAIREVLRRPR